LAGLDSASGSPIEFSPTPFRATASGK
jgi:hypothetical protein